MKDDSISNTERQKSYYKHYVQAIIIISIILITIRIINYFIVADSTSNSLLYILKEGKDLDFRVTYLLNGFGIGDYYKYGVVDDYKAIYLYYWYFLFYIIYIIPLQLSLFIWDFLRIISTIYVGKQILKISNNNRDILFFYLFSLLGYAVDMFLGNTNWLLQLFLFEAYIQWKHDRKWLSGLLFTIAMYKVLVVIFPFVLLLNKKEKFKDLIYFFLPFALVCIPYLIFPEYFWQMISNWTYTEEAFEETSLIIKIILVGWRVIQPAQLMVIILIFIIFQEGLEKEKTKERMRLLLGVMLILIQIFFLISSVVLISLEIQTT